MLRPFRSARLPKVLPTARLPRLLPSTMMAAMLLRVKTLLARRRFRALMKAKPKLLRVKVLPSTCPP